MAQGGQLDQPDTLMTFYVLPAVTAAIVEAKQSKNIDLLHLCLPSCMYRALCQEVEPLLRWDSRWSGSLQIGAVVIQDAQDGT